eukprot:754234-Hanusia_phi.AAC.1
MQVICVIQENRKALLRMLEDSEIASYFIPEYNLKASEMEDDANDEVDRTEEASRIMMSFLDWYTDESQRQRYEGTRSRIEGKLQVMEAAAKKSREKAAGRQAKRLRQQQERSFKASQALDKTLAEADARRSNPETSQLRASSRQMLATWRQERDAAAEEGRRELERLASCDL